LTRLSMHVVDGASWLYIWLGLT